MELLKNLLIPSSDFDEGQEIDVPAKIYALSYGGVIASTYYVIYWTYETIRVYIETEDFIMWLKDNWFFEIVMDIIDWIFNVHVEDFLMEAEIEVRIVFVSTLIALAITYLYSLYGFTVVFYAWRKKVLELYYEAPTYFYDDEHTSIGAAFRFLSTLGLFIIVGSFIIFFIVWVALIGSMTPQTWTDAVWPNMHYLVGITGYMIFLFGFLKPVLNHHITNGDFVKPRNERWWHLASMALELAYIPAALVYLAMTVGTWFGLLLAGFVRPDILFFPRGAHTLQKGHYVFIANAKAYVQRIKQLYEGHPLPRPRNMKEVEARIQNLKKKQREAARRKAWQECINYDTEIHKVELQKACIKHGALEAGDVVVYTFHAGRQEMEVIGYNNHVVKVVGVAMMERLRSIFGEQCALYIAPYFATHLDPMSDFWEPHESLAAERFSEVETEGRRCCCCWCPC